MEERITKRERVKEKVKEGMSLTNNAPINNNNHNGYYNCYTCTCGCGVMFKIISNIRGYLIKLNENTHLLEDRLVNDEWRNYIGHLRTWGELKNKIISKQLVEDRRMRDYMHSNGTQSLQSNGNIWLHLYNQIIHDNLYEAIGPNQPLNIIYIH